MQLSDLASLGSFVSGVAVLISLIYLALQVRQAEKNQRSLIQQGVNDRVCDMLLRYAEPQLATTYRKAMQGEDLSSVELTQFNLIFRSQMLSRQDTFFQYRQKLIPRQAFENLLLSTRDILRNPGLRAMWLNLRGNYVPAFRIFVDQAIRDAPVRRSEDDVAEWRAALAEVMKDAA